MASQPQQPRADVRQRLLPALSRWAGLILPALIALKLTGVIRWSWWWVLAPLWISLAPPVLAAGLLFALYTRRCWVRARRLRRTKRLLQQPPDSAGLPS